MVRRTIYIVGILSLVILSAAAIFLTQNSTNNFHINDQPEKKQAECNLLNSSFQEARLENNQDEADKIYDSANDIGCTWTESIER